MNIHTHKLIKKWEFYCHVNNSQRPSDAHVRWSTRPSLVQTMAYLLIAVKPSSEPMLAYHQLNSWKFKSKYIIFIHVTENEFENVFKMANNWSRLRCVKYIGTYILSLLLLHPYPSNLVQCGAVLTRSIFPKIFAKDTPITGEIWCVFRRFNLWFIFCPRHCSDVCNILLYWTVL